MRKSKRSIHTQIKRNSQCSTKGRPVYSCARGTRFESGQHQYSFIRTWMLKVLPRMAQFLNKNLKLKKNFLPLLKETS